MRCIKFLLIFIVIANAVFAQQKATPFPANFAGNWKGKLQWMRSGKSTQEFIMQLRIQPTDSLQQYTWQIIYGDSANADNRPYILKPVDTTAGHWLIDEKNGIVLDSYVHGNSLHGAFTVNGNTIVDNYWIENDTLYVEFFSMQLSKKKTTGLGTKESPAVDSYAINSYQKAVLTRIK